MPLIVRQEAFDLGITVLPLAHPALEVEEFCRTGAVVVMPRDHPLAAASVITPGSSSATTGWRRIRDPLVSQQVDELFRAEHRKPRIRFVAPNGAVACELAAAGLGVTLADPLVAQSAAGGGLRHAPLPAGDRARPWPAVPELAAALAGHRRTRGPARRHGRAQAAALARRVSRGSTPRRAQ